MTPSPGPSTERDAALAAIAEANLRLDRALMASDPGAAAACFTEDAVLGESGLADVVGRSAIRDFLAHANTVRTVTFHRVVRDDIEYLGDRAIELGRFDETKQKAGATISERGRHVAYWRREPDGVWRIYRIIVSDLPSPSS